MSQVVSSAMEMAEGLRDFQLRLGPMVAQAVEEIVPPECTPAWLGAVGKLGEDWDPEPVQRFCFQPARVYVERGGKQIRPLLAALILRSYGAPLERFSSLLGLVELFHGSRLLLHDMVWRTPERRHGPSALRMFGLHVCGAAFFTLHYHLLGLLRDNPLGLSHSQRRALYELFLGVNFRTGMNHGLPLHRWQRSKPVGTGMYRTSQSPTFRVAATAATIVVGGAGPGPYLVDFADNLGAAYALRGEWLALQTGRPFRTGVPQYALSFAAEHLADSDAERLLVLAERAIQDDPGAESEVLAELTAVGAPEAVLAEVERCAALAEDVLSRADIGAGDRELFEALSWYAAHRNS